jgi:ribosomal protein S18 acetylase RimI-like enzyme
MDPSLYKRQRLSDAASSGNLGRSLSRSLLKAGHVYRRFTLANGKRVTLRVLRWEDLDELLSFINSLVKEKQGDARTGLYTGFDKKVSRDEEAEWLAQRLVKIETGELINVIADVRGTVIANGEVTRGQYKDTRRHGHLMLTMISEYRGQGIGRRMIETLVRECRGAGLRTLHVEFLAENESARRAYEKTGFKQTGRIPHKVFRGGKCFDGLIMDREL